MPMKEWYLTLLLSTEDDGEPSRRDHLTMTREGTCDQSSRGDFHKHLLRSSVKGETVVSMGQIDFSSPCRGVLDLFVWEKGEEIS